MLLNYNGCWDSFGYWNFLFAPGSIEPRPQPAGSAHVQVRHKPESVMECPLEALQYHVDLLGSETIRHRRKALKALAEQGPAARKALPAILKSLSDPWPKVRESAVEAIGRIGGDFAVMQLMFKFAANDENARVREKASQALLAFGNDNVAGLCRILLDTQDGELRERIIIRLGELGDRQALSALTRDKIGPTAAKSIWQLGPDAFVRLPLQSALTDYNDLVRYWAARCFVAMGPEAWPARDALVFALADRSAIPLCHGTRGCHLGHRQTRQERDRAIAGSPRTSQLREACRRGRGSRSIGSS
jgi:hypothetical protein